MQERDSFRLVVRRGPQPNQIYEITKDVTTLGRDITNDIVINDREASRHHLRLVRSGDSITIEDLGSTNGTFVNGKRVSGVTPLQNGDMVGLGETVTLGFEIQRGQQQARPQQSPPPAQLVTSTPPPQPEIPSSDPYAPPAPSPQVPKQPQQQDYGYQQQPQQPQDPYAPPAYQYQQADQGYQGYQQPQQQGYYGQDQASYGTPAPPQQYPGYDYDPYAMREEGGGNSSRWLILGCLVFFLLACACFTIIALVLIDTLNLWCEAPVITQIVGALGYCG